MVEGFVGHMKFGCWLLKGVQVRICCDEKWILGDKLMSSFLVWEF